MGRIQRTIVHRIFPKARKLPIEQGVPGVGYVNGAVGGWAWYLGARRDRAAQEA